MVEVDFEDKDIVVVVCVLEVYDEDIIFKVVESLGEVAVLEMGEKGCNDKTVVVVWAFKVKEVSVAPVNKEL